MKTAISCKLFGAQQVFTGIKDCVTLLHSVVGCNFGSLSFHAGVDMSDVRQVSTVISDEDVVFSGERSLARAIRYVDELYAPELIAVVSGCVSDIIQDDIASVVREADCRARLLYREAAGFRGSMTDGYEEALLALLPLMEEEATQEKSETPVINFFGIGADDPRAAQDIRALSALLGPYAQAGLVPGSCLTKDVIRAPRASLNVVLGRGRLLAEEMEKRFGIPYREIAYPYGLTGAEALWSLLEDIFSLDYRPEREDFAARTADDLKRVYSLLQSLYGVPVSVIGSAARRDGMCRFLTEELGMEVVCSAAREEIADIEDVYERIRRTETAVLFGSSFEQELADEMDIPLVHYDYPAFRRVFLTGEPFLGASGTTALVEMLFQELYAHPVHPGPLYY